MAGWIMMLPVSVPSGTEGIVLQKHSSLSSLTGLNLFPGLLPAINGWAIFSKLGHYSTLPFPAFRDFVSLSPNKSPDREFSMLKAT